MVLTRTAKSCGPDAPTLACRWRSNTRMTVAGKPGHRGEHEISRKTMARGMPGVSGVTVVTNARVYYHTTRGCGRIGRPAFPAPSVSRGRDSKAKLARNTRREREVVFANDAFGFTSPRLRGEVGPKLPEKWTLREAPRQAAH